MNTETKTNLRDLAILMLGVLLLTAALTTLAGVQMRNECKDNGGTFSTTSTLWVCSY